MTHWWGPPPLPRAWSALSPVLLMASESLGSACPISWLFVLLVADAAPLPSLGGRGDGTSPSSRSSSSQAKQVASS